jgi:hypothetical protein
MKSYLAQRTELDALAKIAPIIRAAVDPTECGLRFSVSNASSKKADECCGRRERYTQADN